MRLARRFLESADVVAVRGLLARSYVAGRDGSLTILRNTTLTCPVDGMVKSATGASAVPLTSANACTAQISRDGISLPFVGVFGSRTNLATDSDDISSIAWTAVNVSRSASTMTETAATGAHGVTDTITVSISTTYTASFLVDAPPSGRFLRLGFDSGSSGEAAMAYLAPDGTLANSGQAGTNITFVSASVRKVGTRYAVAVAGTTGAATSSVRLTAWASTVTTLSSADSFAGDTGKAYAIYRSQFEQAAFASPYIPTAGAAVTRDADVVTWTLPVAASAGEMTSLVASYMWGGDAPGINAWFFGGVTLADPRIGEQGASYFAVLRNATPAQQTITMGASGRIAGTIMAESLNWTTGTAAAYRNGLLVGTVSASPAPWESSESVFRVGWEDPSSPFSLISLIYTPGGLTDYERAALARFASGRVIVYAT